MLKDALACHSATYFLSHSIPMFHFKSRKWEKGQPRLSSGRQTDGLGMLFDLVIISGCTCSLSDTKK